MSTHHILALSFNQDASCLAVGHTHGFNIYTCTPFKLVYEHYFQGGVAIVEMLFHSSLCCIVGHGDSPDSSPRHLTLWNTSSDACIHTLPFLTKIITIQLHEHHLIVQETSKIHVLDTNSLESLTTIDTQASCHVSLTSYPTTHSYLAHALPHTSGSVGIYDTFSQKKVGEIQAHQSSLQAVGLSPDGQFLATASTKGTIIRVFSLPSLELHCAFRRGTMPATIHSLSFSKDSRFLCCEGSSSTIHIFAIEHSVQTNLARAFAMIRLSSDVIDFHRQCRFHVDGMKLWLAAGNGLLTLHQLPFPENEICQECPLIEEFALARPM